MEEMIAIAMHLGHQPYSEIRSWSLGELIRNTKRVVDFVCKYRGITGDDEE